MRVRDACDRSHRPLTHWGLISDPVVCICFPRAGGCAASSTSWIWTPTGGCSWWSTKHAPHRGCRKTARCPLADSLEHTVDTDPAVPEPQDTCPPAAAEHQLSALSRRLSTPAQVQPAAHECACRNSQAASGVPSRLCHCQASPMLLRLHATLGAGRMNPCVRLLLRRRGRQSCRSLCTGRCCGVCQP